MTRGARAVGNAGETGPENMKGRSLGERPAFLRSPPGCGVSKPWGVGRGLREAAWEGRWRAMGICGVERQEALPAVWEFLLKSMPEQMTVSNEANLSKAPAPCHLQKCISERDDLPISLGFAAYR